MIVKKQNDKWLVDCRNMENGKLSGSRKYFKSLEEATDFMVNHLSNKSKTDLKDLDNIAIFDNHGELLYLKEKKN